MIGSILGEWFYRFILNLFLIFAALLLIIVVTYIILVYRNVKRRHKIESKRDRWEEMLERYDKGEIDRKFWENEIEKRNETFGGFLVEKADEENHDIELLREIYIDLDFAKEDIERLKSKKWYKKTKTLERWKKMGLLPEENKVLDLVSSQNNSVRLGALDLLSHHKHPGLGKNVRTLFDFYSEDVDDYLLVKLMTANVSIENLRRLAHSEDDRLRRAGVVLLGRKGEKDAVDVLKEFRGEDELIRYEIARSLGRIRKIDAVEFLDKMKDDGSPKVRREVARSMGRIFQEGIIDDSWEKLSRALYGRNEAVKILKKIVDDEEQEVRVSAFLALSNLEEEGRDIINEYRDTYPGIAKEALLNSFAGGVHYDAI